MANDFIPAADAKLDTWATQFAAGIKTNMVALGLTQPQLDAVSAALSQGQGDRALQETARAAWHTAVSHQGSRTTRWKA
jgi:hypothetical protein